MFLTERAKTTVPMVGRSFVSTRQVWATDFYQPTIAKASRHYQRLLALTVGHEGVRHIRYLTLRCLRQISKFGNPR